MAKLGPLSSSKQQGSAGGSGSDAAVGSGQIMVPARSYVYAVGGVGGAGAGGGQIISTGAGSVVYGNFTYGSNRVCDKIYGLLSQYQYNISYNPIMSYEWVAITRVVDENLWLA